jgi:hypothetical protein
VCFGNPGPCQKGVATAALFAGNARRSLGSFDTKQEAALAYDRKVRQCGKHTSLNYNNTLNYDAIMPVREASK